MHMIVWSNCHMDGNYAHYALDFYPMDSNHTVGSNIKFALEYGEGFCHFLKIIVWDFQDHTSL